MEFFAIKYFKIHCACCGRGTLQILPAGLLQKGKPFPNFAPLNFFTGLAPKKRLEFVSGGFYNRYLRVNGWVSCNRIALHVL